MRRRGAPAPDPRLMAERAQLVRANDDLLDAWIAEEELRAAGLMDPDEPSPVRHMLWLRRYHSKRRQIEALGLDFDVLFTLGAVRI